MFFDALFSTSLSAEYSIHHMQGYISAASLSFLIEFLHQVGDNCFKQFRIESSYLTDLLNEFWETPAFLGTCCFRVKCYGIEDNRSLSNLCQWLLYSPPAFDEMKLKTNARVEKTLIIETKCSKSLLLFLINVSIGFMHLKFLFIFSDFLQHFSIESISIEHPNSSPS